MTLRSHPSSPALAWAEDTETNPPPNRSLVLLDENTAFPTPPGFLPSFKGSFARLDTPAKPIPRLDETFLLPSNLKNQQSQA